MKLINIKTGNIVDETHRICDCCEIYYLGYSDLCPNCEQTKRKEEKKMEVNLNGEESSGGLKPFRMSVTVKISAKGELHGEYSARGDTKEELNANLDAASEAFNRKAKGK